MENMKSHVYDVFVSLDYHENIYDNHLLLASSVAPVYNLNTRKSDIHHFSGKKQRHSGLIF